MAKSEELFPQTAGKSTDEIFSQAQELAISGKKEAFDLYLKSAMQGNPAAAYVVSQYYLKGLVSAEELETLMMITYSYVGYYPEARKLLSIYFECRNGPKDGELAAYCAKKAEEGNAVAMFLAGMAHYVGLGAEFDPEKAYGYFCKAADAGNLDGMCQKALCQIRGAGTKQDKDAGYELLKETAARGNVRAGLKYAWCLEHGYCIPRDRKGALDIYVAMANNKVPVAMYEAGRCYMDGVGTDKDENMGYAWFYTAQACGSIEGDFGMARCMLGGIVEDKREEGYRLLKQTADAGCPDAMYMYAQHLTKGGKNVKKDEKAAMALHKRIADMGRASSEVYMAQCYTAGEGVKKDVKAGVEYALRAAAHGSTEGTYLAASALLTGSGVKKDEGKGFRMMQTASDNGYMKATYSLANCYARGRGVKKDNSKAFEYHKKLAEQGFIKSMVFVGEAHYYGNGVKEDHAEALRLFQIGAEKDNALCQYYLGDCYDKGNGVKKDEKTAMKWYKKAADQGHKVSVQILEERKTQAILEDESPFATFEKSARSGNAQSMYILGRYYEDGIGIEKNPAKAKEWYQKAKKRGNAAAKRALEALEKKQ
ncbi:MAG: sel1 repeat family protein [archaeon]|nr:sel1 repeat family protein [archaeon]